MSQYYKTKKKETMPLLSKGNGKGKNKGVNMSQSWYFVLSLDLFGIKRLNYARASVVFHS